MELKFYAKILQNENMDAAYVEVPYDIKELFGKGRLLVNATFDGIPYRGQVVKMGTPCYIIGVTKQIRKQIGKSFGDMVEVVLHERDSEKSPMWQCPKCGREFKKKGYKTDKGTIRIPYGKVDAELIKRIVLWCYETGNHA